MSLTKVSYSMITGAVANVFDYMDASLVALIQAGTLSGQDGVAVSAAIQKAMDETGNVYMPPGQYLIAYPIFMPGAGQILRGAGMKSTVLWVDAGNFPAIIYNGTNAKTVIWHGQWPLTGWINEGEISNFTLYGNDFGGELIRHQGVVQATYKDLLLGYANYGIYGTGNGWGMNVENVRVEQMIIGSLRFAGAYNGCTFLNCILYGKDLPTGTQVHFQLLNDSYGNLFSGGYIEGCQAGVRMLNSQCDFIGVDFEVNRYSFVETAGIRDPGTGVLNFAGPPSVIEGCTFVGSPSYVGLSADGATLQINGNFFVNASPGPGVYAIKGIAGADTTISGFPQPCISEFNNTQRGWGDQFIDPTSIVFTREWASATKVQAAQILQTGSVNPMPATTVPWNFRATGKTWIADYFGYGATVNIGVDTQMFQIVGLGSQATTNAYGFDGYVTNYYNVNTVAIRGFLNYQSVTDTCGKLVLGAYINNATAITGTREVVVDTITQSFRPGTDNSTKLGSASYRWSEVFAGNGTINTSDANQKQQVRSLNDSEKAVAVDLKGLIKAFKFNDSVVAKGDGARIHVGVIAQEVEQAFIKHGLDPEQYGVFCRDTWYTLNGEVALVDENKKANKVTFLLDGEPVKPDENGKYPEGTQVLEEKVDTEEHTLLGVRYDQLFAFIISAL